MMLFHEIRIPQLFIYLKTLKKRKGKGKKKKKKEVSMVYKKSYDISSILNILL